MEIDAQSLSTEATYKLMIGSVVPRPIAWPTTISPAGLVNAAPFSAYTMVSIRPPIVIVNCARRARVSKDTARNAEATRGFVLNVKIDQTRLRPLARLGGPTHARLGEFITMPAPTSAE